MNELIQELADRAIGGMPRDWIQTHDWNIPDEFLEKFAELIVLKCIASIPSDGHRGDFGRAVEFCQQQILEHFGVEE